MQTGAKKGGGLAFKRIVNYSLRKMQVFFSRGDQPETLPVYGGWWLSTWTVFNHGHKIITGWINQGVELKQVVSMMDFEVAVYLEYVWFTWVWSMVRAPPTHCWCKLQLIKFTWPTHQSPSLPCWFVVSLNPEVQYYSQYYSHNLNKARNLRCFFKAW